MEEETSSMRHAYQALVWGLKDYPPVPSRNNFTELERRIALEIRQQKRFTIMRNQQQMGFSNNYWPALSRWLIMKNPSWCEYLHPRNVEALDNPQGVERMCALYGALTGTEPIYSSWKVAQDRWLQSQK